MVAPAEQSSSFCVSVVCVAASSQKPAGPGLGEAVVTLVAVGGAWWAHAVVGAPR